MPKAIGNEIKVPEVGHVVTIEPTLINDEDFERQSEAMTTG